MVQEVCGLETGRGDVVTAGWDQGKEAGDLWFVGILVDAATRPVTAARQSKAAEERFRAGTRRNAPGTAGQRVRAGVELLRPM